MGVWRGGSLAKETAKAHVLRQECAGMFKNNKESCMGEIR